MPKSTVGQSLPRVDSRGKVTGETQYSGDLSRARLGRRTCTVGRLWLPPLRLALVLTFVPPRVGRRLSPAKACA